MLARHVGMSSTFNIQSETKLVNLLFIHLVVCIATDVIEWTISFYQCAAAFIVSL